MKLNPKKYPKKSLGQNFLINPKIAERIVKEAHISKKDTVLEIGPGTGNLTKYLLRAAKKVIAVEKDNALFENLQKIFAPELKSNALLLIHGDILELNLENTELRNILRTYKIVANIPYNITGAIFKKFLSGERQPETMVLMIQKEVAERIMAQDKKESILSISVKAYGKPKTLFTVSRGNFYPSPKVDSAVIAIQNISRDIFKKNNIQEDIFWRIVKVGFSHKRKKLSSNLKNIGISQIPDNIGGKRAENLTLSDWILLAKLLK